MVAHDIENFFVGSAEQLEENWTVQRQTSYGFSSIACDQVIEQTANRDAKTAGGIIGNRLNRGAVHRWLLSQSERTAIARQCQVMAGSSHENRYEMTVVKKSLQTWVGWGLKLAKYSLKWVVFLQIST